MGEVNTANQSSDALEADKFYLQLVGYFAMVSGMSLGMGLQMAISDGFLPSYRADLIGIWRGAVPITIGTISLMIFILFVWACDSD